MTHVMALYESASHYLEMDGQSVEETGEKVELLVVEVDCGENQGDDQGFGTPPA